MVYKYPFQPLEEGKVWITLLGLEALVLESTGGREAAVTSPPLSVLQFASTTAGTLVCFASVFQWLVNGSMGVDRQVQKWRPDQCFSACLLASWGSRNIAGVAVRRYQAQDHSHRGARVQPTALVLASQFLTFLTEEAAVSLKASLVAMSFSPSHYFVSPLVFWDKLSLLYIK